MRENEDAEVETLLDDQEEAGDENKIRIDDRAANGTEIGKMIYLVDFTIEANLADLAGYALWSDFQ